MVKLSNQNSFADYYSSFAEELTTNHVFETDTLSSADLLTTSETSNTRKARSQKNPEKQTKKQ